MLYFGSNLAKIVILVSMPETVIFNTASAAAKLVELNKMSIVISPILSGVYLK